MQDLFLTETAELADVVLPAATWGEKTGTFTNADRTVHLSEQAVDPPGEARPTSRSSSTTRGAWTSATATATPLIKWDDAEGAFEAWKACSRGRPVRLHAASPTSGCASAAGSSGRAPRMRRTGPSGSTRTASSTPTPTRRDYGHDLTHGRRATARRSTARKAAAAAARSCTPRYEPSPETPDDEYPLLLTTGRTVYHFHTRTKTGRAPELQAAAPDVWVELSPSDAAALGHRARATSCASRRARGAIEVPARISGIREGVVFVPFHYGYWDRARPAGRRRVAPPTS